MQVGDEAPAFELPGTDGEQHVFPGGGAASVLVFTCNHCPYALAWHDRVVAVAGDYAGRGVSVVLVNPNDAERYPRDSFDAMRVRVEADGGWPLPYLRDEDQSVARDYGAKTTPDVFVVDGGGRLVYRGAPDADHRDPSQDAAWLRAALDAVLAGEQPEPAESEPVGCSVKWR
jgi:peroxiredoxin